MARRIQMVALVLYVVAAVFTTVAFFTADTTLARALWAVSAFVWASCIGFGWANLRGMRDDAP